jgi:hypothetical protein
VLQKTKNKFAFAGDSQEGKRGETMAERQSQIRNRKS